MFAPLRQLGVPETLIDVVEPVARWAVELGYDRSIPPWEPTPARLLPTTLDLAKVATDLVNALGESVNNAAALFGAPAPLSPSTHAPVAALGPTNAAPKTANPTPSPAASVSQAAAQPTPAASTPPATVNSPALTGPLTEQNSTAPTALAAQTSPTVSMEPEAQQSPSGADQTGDLHRHAEASSPTAGNTSQPSVEPKQMPATASLMPNVPKPAGRPTTQTPAGQATPDVSAPRGTLLGTATAVERQNPGPVRAHHLVLHHRTPVPHAYWFVQRRRFPRVLARGDRGPPMRQPST